MSLIPKIKKKEPGVKLICTIECPECAKVIDVFKETEVLVEPVAAEKKERFYAEKSAQTTLSVSQT